MKLIGGGYIAVLCDSGASISLVKHHAIPRDAVVRYGFFEARGPVDEKITIIGQALIRFGRCGYVFEHKFWITDSALSISTDYLFGCDFLYSYGFDVSCRRMLLECDMFSVPLIPIEDSSEVVRAVFPAKKVKGLRDLYSPAKWDETKRSEDAGVVRADEPTTLESMEIPDEIPVYSIDKHTIPARSRAVITVRVRKSRQALQGLYVVEPTPQADGYITTPALVDIQKGMLIKVLVTNTLYDPVKVKKGTLLGTLVFVETDTPPPKRQKAPPIVKIPSPPPPFPSPPDSVRSSPASPPDGLVNQQGQANKGLHSSPHTDQDKYLTAPSREDIRKNVKLDHLDSATQSEILDLLTEFRDIFTLSDDKIGYYPHYHHKIPTLDGKVVCKSSYKLSYALREPYAKELQRLLANGVIVRSNSEWSNPSIFMHKQLPDGRVKSKIILDSRALNEISLPSVNYDTKRMEESIDFLAGKPFVSRFDIASAFMCLPIAPEDTKKLAFTSPIFGEKFEFTRGVYGLRYMPASFQMAIDAAISGMPKCISYFDDVLATGTSLGDHLKSLRDLFTRIRKSGFIFRLDKTEILPQKLQFLGFEFENNQMRPQKSKLEAIATFPTPKDRKSLKSFLALCGFIRKFCRNFADFARPLFHLTKPSTQWTWSESSERQFQELKAQLLSKELILDLPDLNAPMQIFCDASDWCQGAILAQIINNKLRILAYASRQMTSGERKRSVVEKELSTILWALSHWRMYTVGAFTQIYTDHKPIIPLLKKDIQQATPLLSRMITNLMAYNVEVHYLPGRFQPADCLSRIADSHTSLKVTNPETPTLASGQPLQRVVVPSSGTPGLPHFVGAIHAPRVTITSVADEQKRDSETQRMKESLHLYPELAVINDLLVRKPDRRHRKRQAFVPISLREPLIQQHHEYGHFGLRKTHNRLAENWFFPNMYTMTKHVIRKCKRCAMRNTPHQMENTPLASTPIPSRPFRNVLIDLVGEIHPHSSKKHTHILSIMCEMSKYLILVPLKRTDSETICSKIQKHLFEQWSVPKYVKSDRAQNLTSNLMHDFMDGLRVRKITLLPYSPQNSPLERAHKTMANIIAKLIKDNPRTWHSLLGQTTMCYNTTRHDTTGYTPYEIVTGNEFRFPWGTVSDITDRTGQSSHQFVKSHRDSIRQIHKLVRENIAVSRQISHDLKNKNRYFRQFEVLDLVWFKDPKDERKRTKFSSPYSGPYLIVKKYNPNSYRIRALASPFQEADTPLRRIKPYLGHSPTFTIEPTSILRKELTQTVLRKRLTWAPLPPSYCHNHAEEHHPPSFQPALAATKSDLNKNETSQVTDAPDYSELYLFNLLQTPLTIAQSEPARQPDRIANLPPPSPSPQTPPSITEPPLPQPPPPPLPRKRLTASRPPLPARRGLRSQVSSDVVTTETTSPPPTPSPRSALTTNLSPSSARNEITPDPPPPSSPVVAPAPRPVVTPNNAPASTRSSDPANTDASDRQLRTEGRDYTFAKILQSLIP